MGRFHRRVFEKLNPQPYQNEADCFRKLIQVPFFSLHLSNVQLKSKRELIERFIEKHSLGISEEDIEDEFERSQQEYP